MTFVSFHFYIFLAILVVVYYILPLKTRWIALLVGSLGFYYCVSSYSLKSILMLIGVAIICWISAALIFRRKPKIKNVLLVVTLVVIAAPLLAIKEAPFISFKFLHGAALPSWWIAPVGIAFYTLQLVSYIADVYKEKIIPEKMF